jgi:CRP/FNR family transcriptional regulator, polysaccharide utilization system transcription regulator
MKTVFHSPDPLRLIPDSERLKLLEKNQEKEFKKGSLIFPEGKQANGVYSLRTGKAKLVTTDSQGRVQIIHLARPGDLMGYRGVLGGDSFSCAAQAIEASTVVFIPKTDFLHLLDKHPTFSHAIIQLLTSELRRTEHHLAGLARKHVKSRLAETLLELSETYGFEEDGQTLAVTLTREEFAALVGTATETVIRLLHDMQEQQALKIEGRKLCLTNLNLLKQLAAE